MSATRKEIFLIDPLETLNIKKDSSLLMAHTAKELGKKIYLIFANDLFCTNVKNMALTCWDFQSTLIDQNSFYLNSFELMKSHELLLAPGDRIHMRLDPPFDLKYLRILWMLQFLKTTGIEVVNDSIGILKWQEKLSAYALKESIPSFIGIKVRDFIRFVKQLGPETEALIFKPLDLYQGIGVQKVMMGSLKHLTELFEMKVKELQGPIIVQPFIKEVSSGEIRSLYIGAKPSGHILKIPKEGEFLANIAQGASYHEIDLDAKVAHQAQHLAQELLNDGVFLVAYDILGGKISEVNVTCPGLLVEVSSALKKNVAIDYWQGLEGAIHNSFGEI